MDVKDTMYLQNRALQQHPVILQVRFGEGRVSADLTPILGGRETVSNRYSTQGREYQSRSKKK